MKLEQYKPKTEIDHGAHQACTSPFNRSPQPTADQKESGDYKKGKIDAIGLPMEVECPAGSTRSGTDPDGNEWSILIKHHYGYISNTVGADGEEVDVFVKNNMAPDFKGDIFVVYQNNPDGTFDEHKVIVGADDHTDARKIYLSNYEKGWTGLGKMEVYTVKDFKTKFLVGLGKDMSNKKNVETSAVKVPAEKFTWMKYKGVKNKILTHTKRNGDEVKSKLETNAVYGYRYIKKKGIPQPVAQLVLKQDSMTFTYELLAKTFDKVVLKYSKPTVIPRSLKSVLDVKEMEKAPAATELKVNSKPSTPATKVIKTVKPKAAGSIVWESEDKQKYIKELPDNEFELYVKERGRFIRKGTVISEKGLTYALKSFTSMNEAMRSDESPNASEALRSEVKLLCKKYDIKQSLLDKLRSVLTDPKNVEQILKVVTAYGKFYTGLSEIIGDNPEFNVQEYALEGFENYTTRINWTKDSLDAVNLKLVRQYQKYLDENWDFEDDESQSNNDGGDMTKTTQQDGVTPELLAQLKDAYPNLNLTDKMSNSLSVLAEDYGISVEELVLDLSELSDESNGSFTRALTLYRGKH